MSYSAYAVANTFIAKAAEGHLPELTAMKLQRLMFFAQSWHLRGTGMPLFDDVFQRWGHGPVVPCIFHKLRDFGPNVVDQPITVANPHDGVMRLVPGIPESDTSAHELIQRIVKTHGKLSGLELSLLATAPGGAWERRGGGDFAAMRNDDLERYVGGPELAEQAKAQAKRMTPA